MLLRLAYLIVSNVFAAFRLLPTRVLPQPKVDLYAAIRRDAHRPIGFSPHSRWPAWCLMPDGGPSSAEQGTGRSGSGAAAQHRQRGLAA